MKYQLHCFAQSGNAYKNALMLQLCGADWEPVFVDYFKGAHRSGEFQELNDMAEAPVLVAGDLTLTQSGVILDYLASELKQFAAESETERREILRWMLFDNHKFTGSIAPLRFMRHLTDKGETDVTAFLEARAKSALAVLEKRISKSPFIIGSSPTIADLSLCGYMFWPEETGIDMDDFPAVVAWLERIKALPGWVHPYELMPGHPLKS